MHPSSVAEGEVLQSVVRQDSGPATPRWFWMIAAALTFLTAIPIWLCSYFPSHNGPSLLYIAYVIYEFGDPALGYAEHFQRHPFPIPYLLHSEITQLLLGFVDPITADKLWVTLLVCTRPWAVIFFLRQVQKGREVFGLVCFLIIYDFSLMRGYYNYYAGISLAFLLLGFYIRYREKWTPTSTVGLNVLVLLQYFTHPIALVTTGLMMAAYELAKTRSLARVFGIVARGFVPSATLLGVYLWWSLEYGVWGIQEVDYLSLYRKLKNLLERGPTPLSSQVASVSFAVIVGVGIYAMWCLQQELRTHRRIHGGRGWSVVSIQPMWFVFVCGWALYLAMPWNMRGWHKADVRIIPLLFILTLALPTPLRRPWPRLSFAIGIVAVVLATLLPISRAMQDRSAEISEFTAGIDHFPKNVRYLTISQQELGSERRIEDGFDSLKHVDCYYAIRRGGAPHDSLAWNNTVYTVWYRDYKDKHEFPTVSEPPSPQEVKAGEEKYGAIIMWDQEPGAEEAWIDAGFELRFQGRRLKILANPTNDAT